MVGQAGLGRTGVVSLSGLPGGRAAVPGRTNPGGVVGGEAAQTVP